MHRTEGTNREIVGGVALFTDGPPGTTVNDDWLNAVQEEISNVIEQAGITLLDASTDTRNQLFQALLQISPIPRGFIDGIITENDTDADHDIKFNIGKCRADTDDLTMSLTSALVKQIDANWAEGSNQGGFPSGLGLAIDTWYHLFIIGKTDGTLDAGFDTSLTASNLIADAAPSGYSKYRRVGSVLTDGSSNIIGYSQKGDEFLWDAPPADIATAVQPITAVSYTLSTPDAVQTFAIQNYHVQAPAGAAVYVTSLDQDDETADASVGRASSRRGTTEQAVNGNIRTRTNTSSQVRVRSNQANTTINAATVGWIDPRGKDAV